MITFLRNLYRTIAHPAHGWTLVFAFAAGGIVVGELVLLFAIGLLPGFIWAAAVALTLGTVALFRDRPPRSW